MSTVQHLEEVLQDLHKNRLQLTQAMEAQRLQLEVNASQLERFDTLIATVQHTLSSDALVAGVDATKSLPPPAEGSDAPLGSAGAGAAPAPAPAG